MIGSGQHVTRGKLMLHPTYPLETTRMILRPFEEGDLADLFRLRGDPEVTRYLPHHLDTLADATELLEKRIARRVLENEGDKINFAAVMKDTGEFIGEIGIFTVVDAPHTVEIGYVLMPEFHGKGLASEAAREMLRLAFEEGKFHRVIARCLGGNTASFKAMQRLGMRKEGEFKSAEKVGDTWHDMILCAILEDEWRAGEES